MADEGVVEPPSPAPTPPPPLFRRSHPYRAFVLMTLPFVPLIGIVLLPFIGWILLFVLLPIEFGRIGGRRMASSDAVWVAVPAGLAVGTYELALILTVLAQVPGLTVALDFLGSVAAITIYGCNMFFFSIGALSTSFDPNEVVEAPADESPSA